MNSVRMYWRGHDSDGNRTGRRRYVKKPDIKINATEAEGQYSKRIHDIPTPDIAISMGCNVGCPFIGRPFDNNWGLENPTGKNDEAFKEVISGIENNILRLKEKLI